MSKEAKQKLNLSLISKQANLANSWVTATIKDDMQFKYRPVFSETKKQNVFKNLESFIKGANGKPEYEAIMSDDNFIYFLYLLIVIEFTDIVEETKLGNEEMVSVYYQLVNSGLFDSIVTELPKQEMASVIEKFFKLLENSYDLLKLEKKDQQEIANMREEVAPNKIDTSMLN